jgi:hypothetical protein
MPVAPVPRGVKDPFAALLPRPKRVKAVGDADGAGGGRATTDGEEDDDGGTWQGPPYADPGWRGPPWAVPDSPAPPAADQPPGWEWLERWMFGIIIGGIGGGGEGGGGGDAGGGDEGGGSDGGGSEPDDCEGLTDDECDYLTGGVTDCYDACTRMGLSSIECLEDCSGLPVTEGDEQGAEDGDGDGGAGQLYDPRGDADPCGSIFGLLC